MLQQLASQENTTKYTSLRLFVEDYQYLLSRQQFRQNMAEVLHTVLEEVKMMKEVRND